MDYLTCCVHSTAALIGSMTEAAREIGYRTFRKHARGLDEWAASSGYDTGRERGGLRLKNDFHVAYFRSTYDGRPCVYMVHSAIEYIWVQT